MAIPMKKVKRDFTKDLKIILIKTTRQAETTKEEVDYLVFLVYDWSGEFRVQTRNKRKDLHRK